MNDNVKDYPPYLDYPKLRKPITNADRIRAMTDEELADEYIRIYHKLGCYTDSWAWLRKWLKSPVEVEEK